LILLWLASIGENGENVSFWVSINAMFSTERDLTLYPEVNRVLRDLLGRIRDILNERFLGMYLYGSLAMGDFKPSRSDIDFVVVTEDLLPDTMIEGLETMHIELAKGTKWQRKLEGAYVPKALIRNHDPRHPPVPTVNEGKFYVAPLGSDWVMQRYILREKASVVYGPSLRPLIDPVNPGDLKSAVLDVIDNWWEPMLADQSRLQDPGYQPFAVLSMCRSLYTVRTGELATKSEAANWAMATLPAEWSSLISHALCWGDGDEIDSIQHTAAFIRYVIALCRES
jgi:predicted nucleotidyltransferase